MINFEQSPKQNRNIERDRITFMESIKSIRIKEVETDFEEQCVNSLNHELNTTKLFLLGETHGVKENPDIIYTLFRKFGFKQLALEWNKKLQTSIEKFLETGNLDFEAIKNSSDGRITAGHFALLKKLKNDGLLESIICFDEESSSDGWDVRDANMAKNILSNLSDSTTLVVAGNLHTKVTSITFDNQETEHHTMGENVKKQITNVQSGEIKYFVGQFHNFGTGEFRPKPENIELPSAKFYKSTKGVYIFELPEAHVAIVPNPSKVLPKK